MIVRFTRKYNRTVEDIFKQKIQPKIPMLLQQSVQEIATYCKRNHTWQNRTGALEESINWTPPTQKGSYWFATVFAGGWAKAKYAYGLVTRRLKGQEYERRKRNIRYQRGEAFKIKRGMAVFVNYAKYVQDKGYPVLIQGWERYKSVIRLRFKRDLSFRSIP
jgi:hypothetical protein